jgi:hypothetical protein
MCRTFCFGLKVLRFLLIFEFVYFYTISPITIHLINCIFTSMSHSRPWDQLLHSCALLSNCDIITFSSQTLEANSQVWKMRKGMAGKLIFFVIFCTLINLSFCNDVTNAYRKYSFVYVRRLHSLLQSCVLKWRVLTYQTQSYIPSAICWHY